MKDYPSAFRNGVFLRRETVLKELTDEEKSVIPEHLLPTGPVQRSIIENVNITPFSHATNKINVIFNSKKVEFDFDRD